MVLLKGTMHYCKEQGAGTFMDKLDPYYLVPAGQSINKTWWVCGRVGGCMHASSKRESGIQAVCCWILISCLAGAATRLGVGVYVDVDVRAYTSSAWDMATQATSC